MPSPNESGSRWWPPLITWGALMLVWWMVSAQMPSVILPSPRATLAALFDLLADSRFYGHLWTTLWRGVIGFGVAMVLGTVVGMAMGWRTVIYDLFRPLTQLAISLPPIAWIALLLVWLGLGDGPPLAVVITTTTPLVAMTVAQGIRDMDAELLEMAQVFQFGRGQTLQHIILPALYGHITSAALLALSFTWRVLVMAEFLGSTSGLGNRLSWARQNLDVERVLAYSVVLLVMSLVIEMGLRRWILKPRPWQQTDLPTTHSHDGHIHTHPVGLHQSERTP